MSSDLPGRRRPLYWTCFEKFSNIQTSSHKNPTFINLTSIYRSYRLRNGPNNTRARWFNRNRFRFIKKHYLESHMENFETNIRGVFVRIKTRGTDSYQRGNDIVEKWRQNCIGFNLTGSFLFEWRRSVRGVNICLRRLIFEWAGNCGCYEWNMKWTL